MRLIAICLSFLVLLGCTNGRDLDKPPVPLGDFQLGHSIVVAPNLTKGPLSRDATPEEWIAAVDKAFEDRFRRYEGERLYHFGISVEGYVLARVGVPLVLQPKSVLIYRITVWDDERQVKMNSEPHQVTVLEAISAKSVAGSGLTQTREEQIEALSVLAAKQAEEWLVKQKRGQRWFRGFDPTAVPEEDAGEKDAETEAADAALADGLAEAEEAAESLEETVESEARQLVVEPEAAVTDPEVAPFEQEADDTTN